MTEYPILIERYTGVQSMTIICTTCGTEEVIGPDDLINDDLYLCPQDAYGEPTRCGGSAQMKYVEADPCKNCGKLGFWDEVLGYCCSRVCQLQAEYAQTLQAKRVSEHPGADAAQHSPARADPKKTPRPRV